MYSPANSGNDAVCPSWKVSSIRVGSNVVVVGCVVVVVVGAVVVVVVVAAVVVVVGASVVVVGADVVLVSPLVVVGDAVVDVEPSAKVPIGPVPSGAAVASSSPPRIPNPNTAITAATAAAPA
jgi:hypothetical protein